MNAKGRRLERFAVLSIAAATLFSEGFASAAEQAAEELSKDEGAIKVCKEVEGKSKTTSVTFTDKCTK
jgi:hypothetical protein